MTAHSTAGDHVPPTSRRGDVPRIGSVEGQLTALGIDDPTWLPMLLRCLQRGGCVLIERSGDMLILPEA